MGWIGPACGGHESNWRGGGSWGVRGGSDEVAGLYRPKTWHWLDGIKFPGVI